MNNDVQVLQREIARSLRGLDAGQTQLRPKGPRERWSIQQIVEHLLLTYSSTETAISIRLERRTPTRAKPNLLQHVSQYTVIRLGYFPRGRKAPPVVAPSATEYPLSGEELTESVGDHLMQLDAIFHEGEELFGSGRCASHMILGPMSVAQWRRFHLIHGEHHVKQIFAIRKMHGA
jgi:hypothetical protein